jgi:hypothetical protein
MKSLRLLPLIAGTTIAFAVAPSPSQAGTDAPLTECSVIGDLLSSLITSGGCSIGDKNFSAFSYTSTTKPSNLVRVTVGEFSPMEHTIKFDALGNPSAWTGTGSLSYTVTVNNLSSELINMVTGSINAAAMGTAFTGSVTATGASGTCNLNTGSTNCTGMGMGLTLPGALSTTITNTWNVSSGGITPITNSVVQTPGPLPLLGAGAAFGFSRKLRRRVNLAA